MNCFAHRHGTGYSIDYSVDGQGRSARGVIEALLGVEPSVAASPAGIDGTVWEHAMATRVDATRDSPAAGATRCGHGLTRLAHETLVIHF